MGYRYTALLLGQGDSGTPANKKVGTTSNYVHWKSLTALLSLVSWSKRVLPLVNELKPNQQEQLHQRNVLDLVVPVTVAQHCLRLACQHRQLSTRLQHLVLVVVHQRTLMRQLQMTIRLLVLVVVRQRTPMQQVSPRLLQPINRL